MSSAGKGKMRSVASLINDHINIVSTSILGIVLLVLEKLMDLEFECPALTILAMLYSLVFLVVPTIIVGLVVGKVSLEGICFKIKSTTEEDNGEANIEANQSFQNMGVSETKTKTKQKTCLCACIKKFYKFIKSQFYWIKAVGAWILIVITDGRYLACLVTSVRLMITNNSNWSWTYSYLIQVFQMSGLLLILIVVSVYLCCKKFCCKETCCKETCCKETCCKLLSCLCKCRSPCCKKADRGRENV